MIIHLDRAVARQAHVSKMRGALPFPSEIVSAIDAKSGENQNAAYGSYQTELFRPRYPHALSPTEVACFRSHRKCWQRIVDQDLDAAFVLEDDVEFDPEIFPRAVKLAMGLVRQGDFVRFPQKQRQVKGNTLAQDEDIQLTLPARIELGMIAQIVTKEAAKRLLQCTTDFDRPVDCLLQMPWEHGARVLSVWPSGVKEVSNHLGGSMIDHKVFGLAKLKREINRPIYRSKINSLSDKFFAKLP
ncbi:glycosyltransferase family 25 protein [Seohaeicola saemankumensis]|uniref:glycosyltransferase family 25 protein n=1 Tax=Seohaeicola saemankumensis TaxID=481181 RepID=UPI001E43D26F|nr:glycosyltransferase family 25 protein [Seohaeicola saemankumensis]MCD1627065.1 glycosyltransferase family 25 protein [Seohaeicola saemankumensis]